MPKIKIKKIPYDKILNDSISFSEFKDNYKEKFLNLYLDINNDIKNISENKNTRKKLHISYYDSAFFRKFNKDIEKIFYTTYKMSSHNYQNDIPIYMVLCNIDYIEDKTNEAGDTFINAYNVILSPIIDSIVKKYNFVRIPNKFKTKSNEYYSKENNCYLVIEDYGYNFFAEVQLVFDKKISKKDITNEASSFDNTASLIQEYKFINDLLDNCNSKIWVTSDWHLFKYSENNKVILNYNRLVNDNDIVIHLGDIVSDDFTNQELLYDEISKLKGIKILVLGNNDIYDKNFYINSGFLYVIRNFKYRNILFTHEPTDLKLYPKQFINIHGHLHGNKNNYNSQSWNMSTDRHIDVYFKDYNYSPVLLSELLNKYKGTDDNTYNKIFHKGENNMSVFNNIGKDTTMNNMSKPNNNKQVSLEGLELNLIKVIAETIPEITNEDIKLLVNEGLMLESDAAELIEKNDNAILNVDKSFKKNVIHRKALILLAKAKNDPIYEELAALQKKKCELLDTLEKKYGDEVNANTMAIVTKIGKSTDNIQSNVATKIYKYGRSF